MYIHIDGTVFLDPGDKFCEERQDKDNINRIATYVLANGQTMKIVRHFSMIRPAVVDCDGWELNIELDPETGVLLNRGPLDWGYGWNMKREDNSEELMTAATMLRDRATIAGGNARAAMEEMKARRAAQGPAV
jgi:hypothetical protein